MRDHSHHIELSREAAVEGMLSLLPSDFGARRPEQVCLSAAYGRVLAEDVRAAVDVPTVLTCAMDSVAVHWSDFEHRVPGELPDTSAWVRGKDWEFANTGVAMPEGFDTAVVVEHVSVSDDQESVVIHAAPSKRHAGTRAVGSSMHRGDLVIARGGVITADTAALIASAGHRSVMVLPRPKVAFIPTGNELVDPGLPFTSERPELFAGRGKVFESNSAVVHGKVEAWGGEYVPFDIVPDERGAITEAVRRACEVADIVVLNAGSSKGSDDWSVEVLEEMGTIICHQTNHGPGHHSSYALVDGVPIVGISGPSGGASFTLNFYLLPLMRRFLGFDHSPKKIAARLAADLSIGPVGALAATPKSELPGEQRPAEATEPTDEFFSVKFLMLEATADGLLLATPLPGRPGDASTRCANAYYLMPSGPSACAPKAGEIIEVELRDPSF